MEFQVDTNLEADQLLHECETDNCHPPDSELLAIQKRKSMPKVVIEEFVQVDADSDDELSEDGQHEEEKKTEVKPAKRNNKGRTLTKLKTHHEISDVSTIVLYIFRQTFINLWIKRRFCGIFPFIQICSNINICIFQFGLLVKNDPK